MSSIKTTEKEGDVSIGRHVGIGGNANVQGNVVVHMNMRVEGWLDAKNIKGSNKGIFTTVKKLREAYPRPHDGWWAIVGNTLPSPIYVGDGGEWVATGESGGTPTLEDTDGALQRAVEEVKEKLTESKKAIEDMVKNLPITQELGDSATSVMSQAAVKKAIENVKIPDSITKDVSVLKELDNTFSVLTEDKFVALSQETAYNNGFAFEIYRNLSDGVVFVVGVNFHKSHTSDRKVKLAIFDYEKQKVLDVSEHNVPANQEKIDVFLSLSSKQGLMFYDPVIKYPYELTGSTYNILGTVGSILSTDSKLVSLNKAKIQVSTIVKSYVDVNRLKKSPWEGKKIVVVGDSISDRSVYEVGLYKTGKALDPRSWVDVMKDELGCEVINYGSSGHYMRHNGGDGFSATEAEHTASGKMPKRPHYDTALLGNLDADLFIFEYGVNDGLNLGADQMNSPISENNRNSYTTGMNYVLSKLFEAKPNARCVFVSHWVNIRDIDKQIISAQEAVAKKWNIPCVKWAELCGFSDVPCVKTATINGKQITFNTPQSTYSIMTMKGDATSATTGDICHPFNDEARVILGKIVARQISTLY
ncbi:hypothetical protein [Prevotella melaninogenica]